MADINSPPSSVPPAADKKGGKSDRQNDQGGGSSAPGKIIPQTPKDEGSPGPSRQELVGFAELLFFAYRDFTTDADAILLEYGFGRAHHRVLHFVTRSPGLRVADLLEILKITKQSLARVLRQLIEDDIIEQKAGAHDRRERLLYATAKGEALVAKLSDLQGKRIANALERAGTGSDETVRRFLYGMIKRADHSAVESYLQRSRQFGDNGPDQRTNMESRRAQSKASYPERTDDAENEES